MTDLDKSGYGFQRVRTYLGPSLGWTDEYVQPTTEIKVGGNYVVTPGDSIILVNVAAGVTISLPDVRKWVNQTAHQPATGFDRSITVKDFGGNANNFNIVIAPSGQQNIDNIQQSVVLSVARAVVKLIPLNDLTGWMSEVASVSGTGSGGGDVFKAGANTFTGTNTFTSFTMVPTVIPADNSINAASTAFVKSQNYIDGNALLPYALLASPTFTGNPKAPTPAADADDASIATVGFVETSISTIPASAPLNEPFVTWIVSGDLTNQRIITNSATIIWDTSTPGQIKANSAAGGGNVSSAGSPANGQIAQWTSPTTIQGIAIASLGFQPLDGDLTSLSALTGTNTIYYRSAPEIWSPVTFSGLTFSGGVLASTAGGNVSNNGTPQTDDVAQWVNATTIKGVPLATWRTTANFLGQTTFKDTAVGDGLSIAGAPNAAQVAGFGASADVHLILSAKGAGQVGIYGNSFARAIANFSAGSGVDSSLAFAAGTGATNIGSSPATSPIVFGSPAILPTASTAVTQSPGTNTTQLATTAFVQAAITAALAGGGAATGDIRMSYNTTVPAGWMALIDQGTIGNAASGASRANADTVNLFAVLWPLPSLLAYNNSGAQVSKGANAAADYAANRRLDLPRVIGRSPIGSGGAAGLTNRTLGTAYGSETFTIQVANLAPHSHLAVVPQDWNSSPSATNAPHSLIGTGTSGVGARGDVQGSGSPSDVLGPVAAMFMIIKL